MTDLTDRMRTCAAWLIGDRVSDVALKDAADLLIEASNALEAVPPPLGEPMAIIEPVEPKPAPTPLTPQQALDVMWSNTKMKGTWIAPGGALPSLDQRTIPDLKPRNPRACPKCDSRASKRVRREGKLLMLACPACSATWEWKRSNPT